MDAITIVIIILAIIYIPYYISSTKRYKKEPKRNDNRYTYTQNTQNTSNDAYDQLLDLYNNMVRDFNTHQNGNSVTYREDGSFILIYNFNNGNTIEFDLSRELIFIDISSRPGYKLKHSYTMSITMAERFKAAFNKMVDIVAEIRKRSTYSSSYGYYNERKESYNSKKENKHSNNPKYKKYLKLKSIIKTREEQLDKTPINHPDRQTMLNELATNKKIFNKLKKENNF